MADHGLRRFSIVAGLLFTAMAIVQWNDVDPTRWISFYLAAAAISWAAAFRPLPWILPGLIAATALVGLLTTLPGAVSSGSAMGEQAKEIGGQALVLAWMAVLVALIRRKAAR